MPDWLVSWLLVPLGVLASTRSDYYLPSLCGAAALGGLVVLRRGGRLASLFPRAVYGHPSARLDLAIWLVNTLVFGRVIALAVGTATGSLLGPSLGRLAGSGWVAESWATRGLYTLAVFCAADGAISLCHFLQHRSAVLWEFHKVHHSAQVLVPITGDRQHPVDLVVSGILCGWAVGAVDAVFAWATGSSVAPLAVGGRNAVDLFCLTFLLHLRHTHIWVSWGPRVGRWLMSPAHHQIHHSVDPRHHGRNFGKFLAVWDRLLGTLHVPARQPEPLAFGLGGGEDEAFETLWGCYVLPFRRALALATAPRPVASS